MVCGPSLPLEGVTPRQQEARPAARASSSLLEESRS